MKSYITIPAAVLFVSCFGLPGFADCPSADLTGDCFVDFEDFAVLAGQWLSSAEEPSGYLYWRENSAMLSKFYHPATVHDGWLVGGYWTEVDTDNAGITMWNGSTYRFGASVDNDLGYGYDFLWSVKDVGLFTTTWNGTARNLLKSTDGITDFTVVATGLGAVFVQALNRCFVDCGRQTIDGTEKRLLLYIEYGATAASHIWYSAEVLDADAGNNGTWTDLFGACDAFNHFHGGIYVPNKGLYVFTGDDTPPAAKSILFCSEADIGKSAANHGLITDAATWKTSDRWGLTAGTRAAWAANYKSAYVVGANDNKWRTVDLVTCDGKTGYWIPDSAPGTGGNSIYKIDFQNTTDSAGGTVTTLKSGGVPGYGWYGCGGKNGVAYISTLTYANTGSGGFSTGMQIGCDQYAHIYAIDTQTGEYADVKRIPRSDYIPSIGRYPKSGASFCFIKPLFEYGGEIWGETSFANGAREMTGVSYVQGMAYCGHVDRQQGTQTNIITNPDFTVGANGLTGWQVKVHQLTFQLGKSEIKVNDTVTGATSGATAVVSVVTLTSGSWAGGDGVGYLDLTSSSGDFDFAGNEILLVGATECATLKGGATFEVIDDPTGGGGKVLKHRFECTDLTSAYYAPLIRWNSAFLSTADKNKLYGNMETFSCQFYIKPDSSTDLLTRLYLVPKDSSGLITNQTQPSTSSAVPASTQQGVWHFMSVSDFVPYGAASWYHCCYPHYSKTDGKSGTIYFKDFQLVPGALPNKYIEEQFP